MTNQSRGAASKSGSSKANHLDKRPGAVTPARRHQSTGVANSFGGYTKVNHNNGSFSMRKTGR